MTVELSFANHPDHVCYVRETWTASWTEAPLLRCHTVKDQAAPAHATGQFSYRYGQAILPALGSRDADSAKATIDRPGLLGYSVKVVVATDPPITWFGVLTDATDSRTGDIDDETPTGSQSLTAYGLTLLLEKGYPLTKSFVSDGEEPYLIDVCIPFNGGTDGRADSDRVASANYDAESECFASAGASDEPPEYWTAATAVNYLISNFAPRNAEGDICVPFLVENSDGLNYQLPYMEFDGQTLWQILNRLISRQRGLGWHAVVNNDEEVILKVFSHSGELLPLPGGGIVPANENTATLNFSNFANIKSATLTTSAVRTYDQVIVRGGRAGAVFTVSPSHNLNRDWSEESESDYNAATGIDGSDSEAEEAAAAANADYRARDELHDVFSHWSLPDDWDGLGVRLSDDVGVVAAFELNNNCDPNLLAVGSFWQAGLRFETFVPLRSQVDYSGEVTPDLGIADPLKEFLPPMLFVHVPEYSSGSGDDTTGDYVRWVHGERLDAAADSESEDRLHTWTIQTRVRTETPGLILEVVGGQQHFLAADRFEPVSEFEEIPHGESLNLNDFAATVYLPLQKQVFARMPDEPVSGDVARTLVIDVADAHLDALIAGTVVGIGEDGELVEATGGWLRDDRERLQDIAAIAWVWYGTPRQSIDLSFRSISSDFGVGQLITSVASESGEQPVNTVVTSIQLNLERGEMSLKTQYEELNFEGLL